MSADERRFDKTRLELSALLLIRECWPGYVAGFRKSESPDWVNPAAGIGLEITQAIDNQHGYALALAYRYLGRSRDGIPAPVLRRFTGGLDFSGGRLRAVSPSKGPVPGGQSIRFALQALDKKLRLVNTDGFQKFPLNALALLLQVPPSEADLSDFLEQIRLRGRAYPLRFRPIFLLCGGFYCCIDPVASAMSSRALPPARQAYIEATAEALRLRQEWRAGAAFD